MVLKNHLTTIHEKYLAITTDSFNLLRSKRSIDFAQGKHTDRSQYG